MLIVSHCFTLSAGMLWIYSLSQRLGLGSLHSGWDDGSQSGYSVVILAE